MFVLSRSRSISLVRCSTQQRGAWKSLTLRSKSEHLGSDSRSMSQLTLWARRIKASDSEKLSEEYEKLVAGLRGGNDDDEGRDPSEEDDFMANPSRCL